MTVETRYFRGALATVNGLLARGLLTTSIDSARYDLHSKAGNVVSAGATIGIRVWKRSGVSPYPETEVTSGVPVALAERHETTYGMMVSATWDCPGIALESTDSIIVIVYGKFGTDAYVMFGTRAFSTEQLGAQSLDAATWTVYYGIELWYNASSNLTFHGFDFDSISFNARITNFTWTPAAVAAIKRRLLVGVGL